MKVSNLRTYVSWGVIIGLCCSILACSKESDPRQGTASQADKSVVYTVNYPLAYFARRIGGDKVDVRFPGPSDEDPAYWKPDARILQAYQQADLILMNGAGYAKWTETVSLPISKCINTSSAFQDQYIELEETLTHSHGPTGQHAQGDLAFTTWLDLALALQQAAAIKEALVKRMPQNRTDFEANHAVLENDLAALDNSMNALAEKIRDIPLIVSRPVYQYWTRAYRLNAKSVHWEPDEAPSEQQWAEFIKMLNSHPAKWMVWEEEPLPETVEALNAMQIRSVIFDPCGARPIEKDFLHSMQKNIEDLKQIQ